MGNKRRELQKARKIKGVKEELSMRNRRGYMDLTPYNALSGKMVMSKPTLTNLKAKVPGGFNSNK